MTAILHEELGLKDRWQWHASSGWKMTAILHEELALKDRWQWHASSRANKREQKPIPRSVRQGQADGERRSDIDWHRYAEYFLNHRPRGYLRLKLDPRLPTPRCKDRKRR
jgi:hypothetical protein